MRVNLTQNLSAGGRYITVLNKLFYLITARSKAKNRTLKVSVFSCQLFEDLSIDVNGKWITPIIRIE